MPNLIFVDSESLRGCCVGEMNTWTIKCRNSTDHLQTELGGGKTYIHLPVYIVYTMETFPDWGVGCGLGYILLVGSSLGPTKQ